MAADLAGSSLARETSNVRTSPRVCDQAAASGALRVWRWERVRLRAGLNFRQAASWIIGVGISERSVPFREVRTSDLSGRPGRSVTRTPKSSID